MPISRRAASLIMEGCHGGSQTICTSASPGPEERCKFLEMFFASYKGLSGIIYHNPYNEYS